MRSLAAVLLVAGWAAAPVDPIAACSVGWSPIIEGRSPYPPDAEFRIRASGLNDQRLELYDSLGRAIPAHVRLENVPAEFTGRGTYAALKPTRPLPPGEYSIGLTAVPLPAYILRDGPPQRYQLGSFTVAASPTRRPPMVAPSRLRVRANERECTTGIGDTCQPARQRCGMIVFDFEGAGQDDRDVYDIRWRLDGAKPTRGDDVQGFVSKRTIEGGRRIEVPAGWLGDLPDTAGRIVFEVRSLDDSGRAGPAATGSLPIREVRLLPGPREQASSYPRAVEDRYRNDIDRLAHASDSASSAALSLLSGVSAGPDALADRAFSRAVLAKDGVIAVRGSIRGQERRTSIVMWADVQGGVVRSRLSAGRLRVLVRALPMEVDAVEQVAIWIGSADNATVHIALRGLGSRQHNWTWQRPPDLRREVHERLARGDRP